MTIKSVREFHERRPFCPFEIRMSSGYIHEVDHPEFLAISRDGETLAYYTTEDGRLAVLSVAQINSLELKNAASAA